MTEKCDMITSLKEELEKVQEAERLEKSVSDLTKEVVEKGFIAFDLLYLIILVMTFTIMQYISWL